MESHGREPVARHAVIANRRSSRKVAHLGFRVVPSGIVSVPAENFTANFTGNSHRNARSSAKFAVKQSIRPRRLLAGSITDLVGRVGARRSVARRYFEIHHLRALRSQCRMGVFVDAVASSRTTSVVCPALTDTSTEWVGARMPAETLTMRETRCRPGGTLENVK